LKPVARTALRPWLALLALLFLGCSGAPEDRQDVVIFLIDTLRADRTGPYGRFPSPTPSLDGFAAESIVFEQAYAPAPWTLPSAVSLMTSQPLCEHRVAVDGETVAPEVVTLAERMAEGGRRTGSFISNPYAGATSGLDRGFDTAKLVQGTTGDRLAPWLDDVGGRAFFLYAHNISPHDPYNGARGVPKERKVEVNELFDRFRHLGREDWLAGRPLGTTRNEVAQDALRVEIEARADAIGRLYEADIQRADRQLESVVEELRRRGRFDDAIFIVLSDHGEALGEHQEWQHDQSLHEEVIRVPMLIRLPGAEHAGLRISEPVSLLDVAPTLAELLGEPALAENARGRSLVPWIEGRAVAGGEARVVSTRWNRKKHYEPAAARRGNLNVAIREGSWKAIWNAGPDTLELYDLARDPRELRDRSGEEIERAQRLAALAREHAAPCLDASPEAPSVPELDESVRERLRELGYLDP